MTTSDTSEREGIERRIQELEAEVARLQGRSAALDAGESQLARDLQAALTEAAAAGALSAPTSHAELLDGIVMTAAHVLRAQAASLFLIDEDANELVFEVALGEKAAEVKKFRLPLGQGIAGFTAATGQAIAVADVQRDPRWAQEIGKAIEYVPQSILSVPLIAGDRITGVLELLDKEGDRPFDAADMETAGLFANQAAIAIEQSRAARSLTLLLQQSLANLGDDRRDLVLQAMEATGRLEETAAYRETLQIAATLAEISRRGDAARRLCEQVVAAIDAYLRSTPRY